MMAGLSGSVGAPLFHGWSLALLVLLMVGIVGGEILARWRLRRAARAQADAEARLGAAQLRRRQQAWGAALRRIREGND